MSDMKRTASVLTLARGRDEHLRNVVRGLARQSCQPVELVVGVMQDDFYDDLPATPFPIRQIRVIAAELPLAAARNAVAKVATGEILIFLDVDCIPAPSLVEDYCRETGPGDGMTMGEVLYLLAGATAPGWTTVQFDAAGIRHSDRQGPPDGTRRQCEDYRCFWSLSFAMHRLDWGLSGGFDERFSGYGGEDTDFGRTLHEKDIPIWWIRGARAYHQYHPHCMPPVHHVRSILRNTELFASKWGNRTMEHWLHAFRLMGLIENTRSGLRIMREPDAADFALCEQTVDMPYAASGRVMRILEDRQRRTAGLADDGANLRERHERMTIAQNEMLHPAWPVVSRTAAEG